MIFCDTANELKWTKSIEAKAARDRLDDMISKMAKQAGITDKLKSRNQMEWVGAMNVIKMQVEGIVIGELVFSETLNVKNRAQ